MKLLKILSQSCYTKHMEFISLNLEAPPKIMNERILFYAKKY